MKIFLKVATVLVALFVNSQLKAQSWSDILKSDKVKDVVSSVTGGQVLTNDNVVGEWNYLKPAVKLESENLLGSAAGVALSSTAESTLNNYLTKVGIVEGKFGFAISTGNVFSFMLAGKTISGTYKVQENVIIFSFSSLTRELVSMPVQASLMGESLSLMFTADKLLDLVSTISSAVNSPAVSAIEAVLNKYEGVLLGLEFSRTPGTGIAPSTSDKVSNTLNGLNSLFKR